MSHAEAFGHFRSFAVGLEKNARALRHVLQDNADFDGKCGNGNSGIGSRSAKGNPTLSVFEYRNAPPIQFFVQLHRRSLWSGAYCSFVLSVENVYNKCCCYLYLSS